MISMDLKQQILHLYRVDELSLREIARRTGADRKTVTRLINAYEAAVKPIPTPGLTSSWPRDPSTRRANMPPA